MAINQETFNTDLYKLLRTRGYKPVPKDVKNQRTQPEAAEVFNFTFTKDGKDYGDAWVTIDEAQNVVLYYSNEQEESPSGKSPNLDYDDSWSGLKRHLKQWSMNKQLSFELRNKDELGDDMAQRDYVKKKEKMNEGYHSMGKKASYNDNIPAVKIILQHNRQIEEGEQRYRNIAKIFLENQDGERFLAPTTRPGIAQVYARHIAEGGVPNDERWNHIKSICEEYSKMAGFVRATKNKQFNESAQSLVNEGINHYQSLRETLGKLRGHRGYNTYFESWTPALMEDDTDGTQINELFVQETVDPRIESVMPILSRLHKKIGETPVKEVSELAEWADSIVEMDNGEPDKLSPIERKEKEEKNKTEYKKNLKDTPDAIKKKLNLPDSIDEGEETLEEDSDVDEGMDIVESSVLDQYGIPSKFLNKLYGTFNINHDTAPVPMKTKPKKTDVEQGVVISVGKDGEFYALGALKNELMIAYTTAGKVVTDWGPLSKVGKMFKPGKYYQIPYAGYDTSRGRVELDKNRDAKSTKHSQTISYMNKVFLPKIKARIGEKVDFIYSNLRKLSKDLDKYGSHPRSNYTKNQQEEALAIAQKLEEIMENGFGNGVIDNFLRLTDNARYYTGFGSYYDNVSSFVDYMEKEPASRAKLAQFIVSKANELYTDVVKMLGNSEVNESEEDSDVDSVREKIKSLQATLKSVKGNYPGDDRNRQLIRSEIFDLKQKLKNKSDLSEDSGSDFIHLPPDIFLLHTHKAPRNHVQLWNNWWQRNGFTADEKTNLLRKGNDLYRFNYDEKGLEKVKTDLSEETLEEDSDSNPVESAIIRRIINVRTELLGKHGPEKVLDAVKEVASYVGDVDEIGSSDVSGWIRQVERILGSQEVEEDLDPQQKKAGQLGPTEKVGKEGAVGKLVGANESIDPLAEIKRLIK